MQRVPPAVYDDVRLERRADGAIRRRALVATALVGFGLLFVALGTPICPAALLFGIPCPGCGLTRATLALLHGDFAGALRLHPLVPLLAPLFGGALTKALFDYVRGPGAATSAPSWWAGRTGFWLGGALFALVFGVWVARFAGLFGGPVPVDSLRERLEHARR